MTEQPNEPTTNVTVNNGPADTAPAGDQQETGAPMNEGTGASIQGLNQGEPAQAEQTEPAPDAQPSTTPAESGVPDAPQQ